MKSDVGRGTLILAAALICISACSGRAVPAARPAMPGAIRIADGRPPGTLPYAGSEACRVCHEEIYSFWRSTAHAGSLKSLVPSGDRDTPSCLRCHATGFGERTGYGEDGAAEGLGAVSCESCHGPAALHARSPAAAYALPDGGSGCPPCEIRKVCRRCHTLLRSPRFELARDLGTVACRISPERRQVAEPPAGGEEAP